MKKLRIGLLVEDICSSKYMYELAEWARHQTTLEISHIIVCAPERKTSLGKLKELFDRKRLNKAISESFFNLIVFIESKLLFFSKLHSGHFGRFDLGGLVGRQITIYPREANGDGFVTFSKLDVKRVSALELDLIVWHGSAQLGGDILRSSRLGVIGYRGVADPAMGRDISCFWESYYKSSKTGFAIQTLTDRVDSGRVLLSGYFRTCFYFSLNQASMYRKSSSHFRDLLTRIADSGELPECESEIQSVAGFHRAPNVSESIIYLIKLCNRLGKKVAYRCIKYEKKWGLSFVQSSWRSLHSNHRFQVLAPKGHFWADPFVYAHDGKTYCFVEDYVYKTGIGHIAVLEVTKTSVVHLGDCVKEPFHLSFPFIFQYQGSLYMCPEASASRKIQIYRSVAFPLQWQACATIMEDVAAADTMLFEHSGMWWMLTSIDKSESNDFTSELYLFYSDSPLSNSWTAHPQNPLCIDSEGGRNAGLIKEDGKIYRLAQRQGFDQYGEGLLMFEVTELTQLAYTEHRLPRISPPLSKGQIGTHHLSTTGDVTVFDHVSRTFAQ